MKLYILNSLKLLRFIPKCNRFLSISIYTFIRKCFVIDAKCPIQKTTVFIISLSKIKYHYSRLIVFINRKKIILTIFCILLIWYFFALPKPLFNAPLSLVVKSSNGRLLGARIAADGQWRFPATENVPGKFAAAVIAFEDKRFYNHIGVDLLAVARAIMQNTVSEKRRRGASTLSMQVMRMAFGNMERSYLEKMLEIITAFRLELGYSKKEILSVYASNAPFGGNVVGLEAAAWRYFGKPAEHLSWAESATLAVLPNSPSLVHPGRNRGKLLAKRNFLLQKLMLAGEIDSTTFALAKLEPLPQKPFPLPDITPHLTASLQYKQKVKPLLANQPTTIDYNLQLKVNNMMQRYQPHLQANGIYNAAVLVADVRTGKVLTYAANMPATVQNQHCHAVDNIVAPRSTGSVLKPFLFAAMLEDGSLLPQTLVPDVPTFIKSFTPKNYDLDYEGAVPADKALARSLNIPAVHMLNSYKPTRFAEKLRKMGISTIKKRGDHYGLTLILGGAEANLWQLTATYASMARTLNNFNEAGHYYTGDFHALRYFYDGSYMQQKHKITTPPVMSAGAIWLTFEAMLRVARPDELAGWRSFESSQKIAWKTGTSFGNRDAWSIGLTPDYVVGVWVGNSNGEGRPGLTGIGTAAPILFDVFDALPVKNTWFKMPEKDMIRLEICSKSGQLASDICEEKKTIWSAANGKRSKLCTHHIEIFTDKSGQWRVNSACEAIDNVYRKAWFVLPAAEEKYYKAKHPEYLPLPAYRDDCGINNGLTKNNSAISLLYPKPGAKIYLPANRMGEIEKTVFEAAHRRKNAVIYWSLDDVFMGTTADGIHRFTLNPPAGKHTLTIVDEHGEKLVRVFEILVSP